MVTFLRQLSKIPRYLVHQHQILPVNISPIPILFKGYVICRSIPRLFGYFWKAKKAWYSDWWNDLGNIRLIYILVGKGKFYTSLWTFLSGTSSTPGHIVLFIHLGLCFIWCQTSTKSIRGLSCHFRITEAADAGLGSVRAQFG